MQTADLRAEESLAASRPDRPTLLYDDGCRFCRAMAEVIYHLARRPELAFLPWSSSIAEAWLGDLEPQTRDASMHLKLPDGTLISGNEVFGATLAHVRGLKWIAWTARNVPEADSLLAWTYSVVAGHREFLSKLVPDRVAVICEPQLL